MEGLKESQTWKRYSHSLKLNAVLDYLENGYSLRECCDKYNISSPEVLRQWVNLCTSGKSFKTTGAQRIEMLIGRKYGKNYKLKRIKRLMRKIDLVASIRRKPKGCTKSGNSNYEILDRDFTTRSPNKKWVTDVTYLEYGSGQKAYLSAVKGLYDGYIVSFEIGKHNDDPPVMRTLEKAFKTLERR